VAALTKSTVSQLGSALGMMDTLTKVTSLQSFALLQACASGDLNQVERLLDEGIDVNCSDYDSRTPLHLAAAEGRVSIISILLEKGAKVHAKDRNGQTPLDEATKGKTAAHAEILKRMRADGDATNIGF
jgi:ankyrin repeat protein